jgi:xanthine dehydrogenase accessory factor
VKNIFHSLLIALEDDRPLALATILGTIGSAPQVPGASAVFSTSGVLSGTLGGGVLEGDATLKAAQALKDESSEVYEFDLDADITAEEGAICGGKAILLMDADPGNSTGVFRDLEKSISNRNPGVLATVISGQNKVKIERSWIEQGSLEGKLIHGELNNYHNEITSCLEKRTCLYLKETDEKAVFLEPVYPMPKLIIAGAGHIGKALAHMANLLEFEVIIIDDRTEYANRQNIPDADHIIVDSIGKAVQEVPKSGDTYIVIVTRGHRDDADALKACIDSEVPYIGMIGSKKKVRLMREDFLSRGWATAEQFNRIHAPVGIEIGSKTVQEITVSICAQLIQVRNQKKYPEKYTQISAIILAAGESIRMGKPKLLLPFGDASVIEMVVTHAARSALNKIFVVLGSGSGPISRVLQDYPVETVYNKQYKQGMLSSVQCGLRAVPDSTDAVMVLLGDQPMIGHGIINDIIKAFRKTDKGIIIVTHLGQRGHPILFHRKYIKEVTKFPVAGSLKDLLKKYPGDIEEMETGQAEILRDIDTEKDYQKELKYHNDHD